MEPDEIKDGSHLFDSRPNPVRRDLCVQVFYELRSGIASDRPQRRFNFRVEIRGRGPARRSVKRLVRIFDTRRAKLNAVRF